VRERKSQKPRGSRKLRKLGISVAADRVVQSALKMMRNPYETDFKSVSYGFRPERRANDAIANVHFYGTHGYR
jgi:RNA-directed DNA polymerase